VPSTQLSSIAGPPPSLPDEPYARQLRQGFGDLRFAPPLEAEYAGQFIEESRRPALIVAGAALLIWSVFAVLDFVRLDLPDRWPPAADIWVLLTLRWLVLALLALFLLPWTRQRLPLDRTAFGLYGLLGVTVAATAVIYKANGLPAADTAQIVVVMAAFLPMGMRFYAGLVASLALVLVTAVAGLVWLPQQQWMGHLSLVLVMVMAVPVAAVGGYLREYAHRRQFLLGAILSRQAQFDSLTDLANRRLFQRHASAAIAHAARSGEPLVLAVIDIDHFKRFNDNHGHAAGDDALIRVADAIRDAARRPMDMAARLGGEEFALLLYGTDLERAGPVLEALRARVGSIELPHAATLTVSIGATMPRAGEGLGALYERADRLLYASKDGGRNRLSVE